MLLETTTPIKGGSVSGGLELLPGLLVQVSPQAGGFVLMAAGETLEAVRGRPTTEHVVTGPTVAPELDGPRVCLVSNHEGTVIEEREDDRGCRGGGRQVEGVACKVRSNNAWAGGLVHRENSRRRRHPHRPLPRCKSARCRPFPR